MSHTAPTPTLRTRAVERLMALISDEFTRSVRWPDLVTIHDYDPGGDAFVETLFPMRIRGTQDIIGSAGAAAAAITGDEFAITIAGIAQREGMDGPMARARIDEFYRAVRTVAYGPDYRCLRDLDGVDQTYLGDIEGPNITPDMPHGYRGAFLIDFIVTTYESEA